MLANWTQNYPTQKNPIKFKYRNDKSLRERKTESARIRVKYPDRIPVICEVSSGSAHSLYLDRSKYLVPTDLTVGQFLYIIRKRIKLNPEQALFLFTDGATIPATAQLMSIIYNESKNEDGFLYFSVSSESTFG